MTGLGGELSSGVLTALLPLLTAGVLATAKFLADVRRQLDQMRTLMLGYEGKGGGLLDQLHEDAAAQEKVKRDLDVAWSRIRELERRAGIIREPPLTLERGAT